MLIQLRHLSIGLLAVTLSFSPAMAKGGGKDHGHSSGKKEKKVTPGHADKPGKEAKKRGKDDVETELWVPAIRMEEARRLAQHHHYAGQKPLPPGIRKNLMRAKPLPPGIAKKRLPAPYLATLPLRPGYKWHACGTDLVLVSMTSNLVAHVMVDALR